MTGFDELWNKAVIGAKANSPAIFAGLGIAGLITTSYLAARGAVNATRELEGKNPERKEKWLIWGRHLAPAGISGILTVGSIIGITRSSSRKTIAAQTALAVTERAYSEYRNKVVEEFGARKDQSIRDKVAEERVLATPPPQVLISGPGNVLCCEMFTMRYFLSDMDKLKKAQNEVNDRLIKHDYATLDDFYYLVGLTQTSNSGEVGWKSGKLMELEFTTVLTEDGRPCLAFDYNYVKPL